MPDITMCLSESCPYKNKCYRAQANPNPYYQSYSNFEYVCNKESGFEDFIKMSKTKRKD